MMNRKIRKISCFFLLAFFTMVSCKKVEKEIAETPTVEQVQNNDLEYLEDGMSTMHQYQIKDGIVELEYYLQIVNHSQETKYFYLYADMAKEDDNLVEEDTIPAYEKSSNEKQIFMLNPGGGGESYFKVYFRGTHGSQEKKERKSVIAKENVMIEEISKEEIPENANIDIGKYDE